MSVCEIGATIGRMWRELSDEEKQKHNDDFTNAKVRYLFHFINLRNRRLVDFLKIFCISNLLSFL